MNTEGLQNIEMPPDSVAHYIPQHEKGKDDGNLEIKSHHLIMYYCLFYLVLCQLYRFL